MFDAYRSGHLGLSFELFPPKTDKGESALEMHVDKLAEFNPDFFTCTYGAGGSTRDKTLEIVSGIRKRLSIPVCSHLTCVGSTVEDLRSYLNAAKDAQVDGIVALRGDPPQGETTFKMTEGGLRYANELVALIRSEFPEYEIAVAGYPEKHQEAPSADVDLENLKRKVDAGATAVITQLFYDNEDFWRFREKYEAAGINVPLVPGLLPVTNLGQIERITSLCGAKLPNAFHDKLAQQDDADWQFQVGVEFAAAQLRELIEGGIPGLHLYVLNKSQAAIEVLGQLGWQQSGATA